MSETPTRGCCECGGTGLPHEHRWIDTGFADLDECTFQGCRATRSSTTDEVVCWVKEPITNGSTGDP